MKIKLQSIMAALCVLSSILNPQSSFAQTNPPVIASPVLDAFNFLSTPSSNWMFATYGIFTKGEGEGVGIGALYKVSENFGAVLRLDRIGNDTFMPSGNFQVQVPVTLMGKVTVVPFAFTGIATPLNASPGHDGVVGVFGIGTAIRVPDVVKSKSRFLPDDVIYDYEKWTSYEGGQHRIGFLWKF
jgi:hypothetical protein